MSPLDPTQQAAATATADLQLVLAGPGSGKTTTLTARFVHLVRQGIDRKRILALTFTRKAADDMKRRIVAALELDSAGGLTVATFHAFAFRHLRSNPRAAGLADGFQLWDAVQQRQVFTSRKMWWNEETDILDIIAGAKERLLDAERFAREVDPDDEVLRNATEFFSVYETVRRKAGAIDFADIVPLVAAAMDNDPAYAAAITHAYDHVLVDEYQDVNPGQVRLLDHFVKAGAKLWAVGDDDQTLYAFRAADVRFILEFAHKYRGTQVHVLNRNYRSAVRIIAAAKRLIANNRRRRPKDYQPAGFDLGEIVIRGYPAPHIEARQVARAVAKLIERGHAPRQIAVLYRVGSVGLALQPALQELRIPYEVRGAGDLWGSVAARLVVGSLIYLRDGTSVDAMSRMGSSRRAEIIRGKLDEAGGGRISYPESCRLVRGVVSAAVPGKASNRDRAEWTGMVEAIIAFAVSCQSLQELETKIAAQSAALREAPENAVVLSTVHSAKGLEWDAAFVVGMEEGVLPHANNDDLEEERRVAYVAMTRAKRILGLTYASLRYGQPARASRFLHEIAGRERRHCIWTEPQIGGANERLPLLSARERQRLGAALQPEEASPPPARNPGQRPRSNTVPTRHGSAWSAEEDARLRAGFLAGEAIAAIAKAHQRKRGAITSRLVKLGLLADRAQVD